MNRIDSNSLRRRTLAIVGLGVVAVVVVALLDLQDHGTVGAPAAGPSERVGDNGDSKKEQVLVRPLDASSSPVEIEQPTGAERVSMSTGVPPSPDAQEALERMRVLGLISDPNVVFTSAADCTAFVELWDSMTRQTDEAFRNRLELGKKLAKQRLDAGNYSNYDLSKYQRTSSGGYVGPWDETKHADDWFTNVFTHDGDMPVVRHVRIPFGECQELDDSARDLHAREACRREAILAFLSTHTMR